MIPSLILNEMKILNMCSIPKCSTQYITTCNVFFSLVLGCDKNDTNIQTCLILIAIKDLDTMLFFLLI